ncbi:divalent-cation tolerance protein CutA [Natrarchaeobius halalkaliphilus]|uniref:Divalent-cation tolerance protein CutA n=1 Tax=Natrarchaeobius halalkaliphilus TaxID=1679091 RepID=A0A3N6P6I0_9EURY|nr:divalent-cation tolerance protein CutA [Natrarchaeobius halalkaliphilus]RQG91405.1 divalent-cation tolerance protein CutA [Natrarchaeobius halalkaliphilus]
MTTVYITAPPEEAERIARVLVEERLAACVNRIPTTSTYRWDGEIHHDDEVVLLAKTTDTVYAELENRVLEIHPHEVPCIERFDESHALESFAEWRGEVTQPSSGESD